MMRFVSEAASGRDFLYLALFLILFRAPPPSPHHRRLHSSPLLGRYDHVDLYADLDDQGFIVDSSNIFDGHYEVAAALSRSLPELVDPWRTTVPASNVMMIPATTGETDPPIDGDNHHYHHHHAMMMARHKNILADLNSLGRYQRNEPGVSREISAYVLNTATTDPALAMQGLRPRVPSVLFGDGGAGGRVRGVSRSSDSGVSDLESEGFILDSIPDRWLSSTPPEQGDHDRRCPFDAERRPLRRASMLRDLGVDCMDNDHDDDDGAAAETIAVDGGDNDNDDDVVMPLDFELPDGLMVDGAPEESGGGGLMTMLMMPSLFDGRSMPFDPDQSFSPDEEDVENQLMHIDDQLIRIDGNIQDINVGLAHQLAEDGDVAARADLLDLSDHAAAAAAAAVAAEAAAAADERVTGEVNILDDLLNAAAAGHQKATANVVKEDHHQVDVDEDRALPFVVGDVLVGGDDDNLQQLGGPEDPFFGQGFNLEDSDSIFGNFAGMMTTATDSLMEELDDLLMTQQEAADPLFPGAALLDPEPEKLAKTEEPGDAEDDDGTLCSEDRNDESLHEDAPPVDLNQYNQDVGVEETGASSSMSASSSPARSSLLSMLDHEYQELVSIKEEDIKEEDLEEDNDFLQYYDFPDVLATSTTEVNPKGLAHLLDHDYCHHPVLPRQRDLQDSPSASLRSNLSSVSPEFRLSNGASSAASLPQDDEDKSSRRYLDSLFTPYWDTSAAGASGSSSFYSSSSSASTTSDLSTRESRDDRKARLHRLPFSCAELIAASIEEFSELISRHQLTEAQINLCRDIRRRGKNKVAAQNCRRKKMGVISSLQEELDKVRQTKQSLLAEREYLYRQRDEWTAKLLQLEDQVLRGMGKNPQDFALELAVPETSRGSVAAAAGGASLLSAGGPDDPFPSSSVTEVRLVRSRGAVSRRGRTTVGLLDQRRVGVSSEGDGSASESSRSLLDPRSSSSSIVVMTTRSAAASSSRNGRSHKNLAKPARA